MPIIADRVQETTTSTGTGTINLAGAKTGYRSFVSGAGDAAEVHYTIVGQVGETAEGEWEVGIGTVTDATPDTLSRTTVLSSSNAGSLVNFSAGTKDVFLTLSSKRINQQVVAVQTQAPSAVATLDFDISGYRTVMFTGWLLPASDGVECFVRLSNDGGSTFRSGASDYGWYQPWGQVSGGGTATGSGHDSSDSEWTLSGAIGNVSGEGITIQLWINDASESSRRTAMRAWGIVANNSTGIYYSYNVGGVLAVASEVNDAIRFLFSTGNIASGKITMYGYPDA